MRHFHICINRVFSHHTHSEFVVLFADTQIYSETGLRSAARKLPFPSHSHRCYHQLDQHFFTSSFVRYKFESSEPVPGNDKADPVHVGTKAAERLLLEAPQRSDVAFSLTP